ncbi:ankyrin repeat domain-containing protein [Fusobacterium nucleatum]|uniref:ankyrin repeat domain-containing protein n=1 Tax=Fusobacterium nucleatum TaxID=851 RepID=UPI0030D49F8F
MKKKIFKLLLDAGIENDIKNDNGDTPIDILSNQKTDPILLSILKGKYDFDNPNNITNLTSAMSLYSAILSNNYDVIKAHLEMEIDINEISEENNNSYGLSPLGVACHILDLKSVELLENDADVGSIDKNGYTVLMYTALNTENGVALEIAKMLHDFGDVKISYINNDEQSAMDIAVKNNNENLVNWLLTKI